MANMNELQLISYVTALKGEGVLMDYEIARILELSKPVEAPKVEAIQVDALLIEMQAGQKIAAIRAYRALTNAGVRESKEAVERYWTAKEQKVD